MIVDQSQCTSDRGVQNAQLSDYVRCTKITNVRAPSRSRLRVRERPAGVEGEGLGRSVQKVVSVLGSNILFARIKTVSHPYISTMSPRRLTLGLESRVNSANFLTKAVSII